ncbi:CehA/McbA family metallohydrolase [Alkalihalobacterium bogoriense]|uniref:CehA/McbA family metallohydrolase n=1 Tax=Alkalihalobacterium bogoriense TaxID=246272 RepID=UPI00068792B8|nr:CehA/McbA family metallohydrolase [Alkalihalobacterium bogoriense]
MKTVINGMIGSDHTLPINIHTFTVEEKVEWIGFVVHVTKKKWLGFLLWDSNDRLRAQYLSGKAPKEILLHESAQQSSILTIPGEITKGEWRMEVVVADASTPTNVTDIPYEIIIETGLGSSPFDNQIHKLGQCCWTTLEQQRLAYGNYDWERSYCDETRWYKGDFHTHTIQSDGKMTPAANVEQAQKNGLDFFVATDHHVMTTGWSSDEFLVIPGIEITSTKGHFNALGPKGWIDWRFYEHDGGMETEEGMKRVLQDTKQVGALRSLNHPFLKPWHWVFQETKLDEFDCIEIWNDPTYQQNTAATEDALHVWSVLWNEGFFLPGIGGSDSHLLPTESYKKNGPPSVIGDPATYVFSNGLSANEILHAVKKGRVYVSRGPVLDMYIKVENEIKPLGTDLSTYHGKQAEFVINYENVKLGSQLQFISRGEVVSHHVLEKEGQVELPFQVTDEFGWYRIDIRDEQGELLAFSNPVYYGKRKRDIITWSQLLEKAGYLK